MIAIGCASVHCSERAVARDPGAEQPVVLGVCPRRRRRDLSNRELSIGVSVKLTSIETRIANAIVQPNG